MLRTMHRILLVDDELDERLITERALKKCLTCQSSVHLVSSGRQAICYMMGEGPYADRKAHPFPTLIMTDLNMADGDGFDVLEFLQSNPEWSVVPRIMFSSSDDDDDVRTAFVLGASAYHRKPVAAEQSADFIQSLIAYWATCEVPPVDETGRLLITNCQGRVGARYPQLKGAAKMVRPQ